MVIGAQTKILFLHFSHVEWQSQSVIENYCQEAIRPGCTLPSLSKIKIYCNKIGMVMKVRHHLNNRMWKGREYIIPHKLFPLRQVATGVNIYTILLKVNNTSFQVDSPYNEIVTFFSGQDKRRSWQKKKFMPRPIIICNFHHYGIIYHIHYPSLLDY